MKKKIFTFILTGFLLITLSLVGQNKNYPTKKINGIEYYVYTVQISEGLYAIGRKFDISPDIISKTNPEIASGLKPGQKIFIPIQDAFSQKKIEETSKINNTKQEFTEYKVKKKQTLFGISQKFNVSQEDIIKYNPDIANGLREGIILHIPKESKKSKKNEKVETLISNSTTQNNSPVENKRNGIHVVRAQETLYSLARLYNVKVIDIIRLNPGSSTKLTVGTELKIPKTEADANKADILNNQFSNTDSSKSGSENKIIKIAFLLPFMLDQDKPDLNLDRFLDFYAGALIAVEKAKEQGISTEIYTYDTEKSDEKIMEVLSNPELKNMDLIIGPAFSNQVPAVAEFAKGNKINTLIPFSSKVPEIDNNSYLFQFNPGTDLELKFTIDLLKKKYNKANIIFAELPGISSFDEGRMKFEALQKVFIKERKQFSNINLTTSDEADFKSVLNKKEKNIIIFNTDKYAYINPFINPIKANSNNYDIVLFEPYNWKNQKDKLAKNIYISPFRAEIDSTKLNDFDKYFAQLFYSNVIIDSPRFDLLGYDLAYYFISLIHRYPANFINKVESFDLSKTIQSMPRFERISNESGFINKQLYVGEDNTQKPDIN
ncbi:MAG: LysM peptidoglycan-binding domain-containing protein [Paludibacter sp.]